MWIGVGHQAFVLQPIVRAPNLRPAKKETLLGSEAILVRWTRLALQGLLVRRIGDRETSEVRDAFAENELAILVQIAVHDVIVKLRLNTSGAFLEILHVVGGPPILQVAAAVKLAPMVVEAMSDFMADDRAHTAVVHGVISLGIIKGRLQDAGGKDDFVHAAIVVGVDRGRRHAPFRAVHRLADFRKPTLEFERGRTPLIYEVGNAVYL